MMMLITVSQYLKTRPASSREFREGGGLQSPAGRDLWLGELPLRAGERLCHREDGGQHREEQVTGREKLFIALTGYGIYV